MSYKTILTQLYFILIYADGHVNEHEQSTGRHLAKSEGLEEEEFRVQLELLKSKSRPLLLEDCIKSLKKLDRNQQIRMIAWLCVVANGDGFMDRSEWQLIYKIYHKELHLPLEEIFKVQKELNRQSREQSSSLNPLYYEYACYTILSVCPVHNGIGIGLALASNAQLKYQYHPRQTHSELSKDLIHELEFQFEEEDKNMPSR